MKLFGNIFLFLLTIACTLTNAMNKDELLRNAIHGNNLSLVKGLFEESPYPPLSERTYWCFDEAEMCSPIEFAIIKDEKDIVNFLVTHPAFSFKQDNERYQNMLEKLIKNEWWTIANYFITRRIFGQSSRQDIKDSADGLIYALNNNVGLTSTKDMINHIDTFINEPIFAKSLRNLFDTPESDIDPAIINLFFSTKPGVEEVRDLLKVTKDYPNLSSAIKKSVSWIDL